VKYTTLLATVLSLLLLASCTVGPNYRRPQVSVPNQWTVAPARGISSQTPETDAWWSSFQDPELNSLITRAVDRNLDLKLALERVQESRAARGVVRSAYFPSIDANVSATRERVQLYLPASLPSPLETNIFEGYLSVSWELDVFGGIRRAVEAATADVAAAEDNRRDVLVILLGDVGRAYTQLRGFQRQLEIANKNLATQQDTPE